MAHKHSKTVCQSKHHVLRHIPLPCLQWWEERKITLFSNCLLFVVW